MIRRYVAIVNPKRVGLGLMAFVNVKLEKRGRTPADGFARAVGVENLDHFSRFVMDSLLKHPGVLDVKSSFVLEEVKETTALPLAHFAG